MSRKILMIDDEPGFMRPIIERLMLEGYSLDAIIYCSQIDEGFTALRMEKDNIACMSLDLLMGDNINILKGDSNINGLNALSQLRKLYPALPIVCYSILGEEEGGIREAMSKSNASFISKTDSEGMEKLIDFFKLYDT